MRNAPRPLVIEVLAPSLVGSGLPRTAAHSRQRVAPGPGDVGGEDAYRLLRFLDRLRDVYDGRIVVHLVEPFSLAWMVRILRHRPRRFPLFVLGGRAVVAGLDEVAITRRILSLLGISAP